MSDTRNFIAAINEVNIDKLKSLITSTSTSLSTWPDSFAILYQAVKLNHKDIIDYLLHNNAHVNKVNSYWSQLITNKSTPLHAAVKNKNASVVQQLLDKGANPNAQDVLGKTPLRYAIESNDIKMVDLLIPYSDINLADNYDQTPVYIAVKKGYLDLAKHLLAHQATANCISNYRCEKHHTPLHAAVNNGQADLVNLLIAHKANIEARNANNMTSLHIAIDQNSLEIAECLLAAGADVNAVCRLNCRENCSALCLAAMNGNDDMVQLLLAHGADINAKKSSSIVPLHAAVRKEHLATVECLLALGADIHKRGVDRCTVLHTATCNKSIEVAEFLISKGASVNGRDINGVTPLHMAVLENNLGLVEFLLEHDADINATGNLFFKDCTPLHLAVTYCAKDMVQLLVSRGARIDGPSARVDGPSHKADGTGPRIDSSGPRTPPATKTSGPNAKADGPGSKTPPSTKTGPGTKTPLRMAIDGNHLSIVQCLVEHGTIDERTTAIHLAVESDNNEVVKLLLKAGVYINTKDATGRTPCHLSAANGYQGILQTILEFGGDVNARDVAGRTPLHYAVQRSQLPVILMLLKYGANINCLDNDKQSPLLTAFNSSASRALFGDTSIEDLDLMLLLAQHPKEPLLKVLHLLIKHIVMLKMAQLYVCKENLNSVPRKFEEVFADECKIEVDKMKRERVFKKITCWDLLRITDNYCAKLANKIDLLGLLNSGEYKSKFPIYYPMIMNQMLKAIERSKLLKRTEDLCEFLVDSFNMPYHCIELIVRHLGTDDLRMHVNTAELRAEDYQHWEEMAEEFEDRRRRQDNIILFGVPETGTGIDARGNNDEELVGRILHGLKQVVPDAKCSRIGEFETGVPRPLRVVVGEDKVDALLLEHSRLRRLMMLPTVLQGIVITRDLTVMQREQGRVKRESKRKTARRSR
ncbi:putative ankyrin repeat protein RF_0381 [Microplitis demolitor]|uniref:putative ankyrin repeat protein RF_0381 n=1 Tax=Microplitis demolitor TaxID=69319 RepID=UPI0004CCF448|nr:putative ankyrin repeat protein RF_0381 [Microplitis demolitor]